MKGYIIGVIDQLKCKKKCHKVVLCLTVNYLSLVSLSYRKQSFTASVYQLFSIFHPESQKYYYIQTKGPGVKQVHLSKQNHTVNNN